MSYTTFTSDSFNRADATLNGTQLDGALGGAAATYTWVIQTGGGWQVAGNHGVNPNGAASILYAAVAASTGQKVTGVTYGDETGIIARLNTSTGEYYLLFRVSSATQAILYYYDGAAYNSLKTATVTINDGASMALECQSGTQTCYVAGTHIAGLDATDTHIASGVPAMFSNGGGRGFDSFLYETGTPSGATPTQLILATPPVGNQSGVAFPTQPVVNVADAGAATVTTDTSTVTASITVLTGSVTLGGTTSKAAVAGVATFTNLAPTGTGSYTMTFSDGALTVATTGTLWVGAAALHITSQPTTAYTQRVHGNVVVAVRDGGGTLVANATNSVAIVFTLVSKTGVLTSGTTLRSASSGLATFNDLLPTIEDGATWTYAVSSSGLTGDTSSPITGIVRSLDVTDTNT